MCICCDVVCVSYLLVILTFTVIEYIKRVFLLKSHSYQKKSNNYKTLFCVDFCFLRYFEGNFGSILDRKIDLSKYIRQEKTGCIFPTWYTVSELEVTNYKRLEMIEILNNCCISCLYLQEYKKGFAFLTKCHYFESRGGLN